MNVKALRLVEIGGNLGALSVGGGYYGILAALIALGALGILQQSADRQGDLDRKSVV